MSGSFVESIVKAITTVTDGPCVLHEPVFRGRELKYVTECIETGWVSSVGSYVDRIEQDLSAYTGAKHVVATVNGTSALHVALVVAGVKPADEVIVPALSFVATANAVTYCGATPHFVDVETETMGMDADQLLSHLEGTLESVSGQWRNRTTGSRVAAIVPMHTFGHPCDIEGIVEIGQKYQIPVVEDAAESLGSFRNGQHTGTFAQMGVLSFNGNKIVTSGGGGAILTNDSVLAKRLKHLTTTAKVSHRWEYVHDQAGFNYRMPNLNAALACAQLEQLEGFIRVKRETAERYSRAFAAIDGVSLVHEPNNCMSNYWLNAIRLDDTTESFRNEILAATNDSGVMTRPCWTPINRLPMYQSCYTCNLDNTDTLFEQLINIPSGVGISQASE
ncbi:LegC family aminotransferase [Rhodopirellula baltica]|uniref:GDP-perosamine synthase n=1 Tax=Rhodopirellula baltica WH47 TaxID=991778 RepID=F2ALQ2_RHOBT|nr:LegC family aminotransferase [Rhodopirellula baltica]EGF29398.1 perosamine synthetase [Rhodopirellula baltica WH47]